MLKLIIENLDKFEIVFNNDNKSLLYHIGDARIDWMQACGAKGRCTTCRAVVVEGMDNLSELTEPELNYRSMKRLADNERLCCQTYLLKNEVIISVPEKCKLPHVKYSS